VCAVGTAQFDVGLGVSWEDWTTQAQPELFGRTTRPDKLQDRTSLAYHDPPRGDWQGPPCDTVR